MTKFEFKNKIFIWGPNKIRLFYVCDWLDSIFSKNFFQKIHKDKKAVWPPLLLLSKDKNLCFVGDENLLEKVGAYVFTNYILNIKRKKQVWLDWKKDLKKVQSIEKKIDKIRLDKLSQSDFCKLWEEFHYLTKCFWQNVIIPELANYGSIDLLKQIIKKELKVVNENELSNILEVLTAPNKSSFYEIEEIELKKTNNLSKHTKKYFWLKNNYGSVEVLGEDYFKQKKKKIIKNIITEIQDRKRKVEKTKKDIVRLYNIPKSITNISKGIVECIEWQDARKKHIWIYLHYKDLLINEVSRRFNVSKDFLLNFREKEISEMLLKRDFTSLDSRQSFLGFNCSETLVEEIEENEVKKLWKRYIEFNAEKQDSFSGIVASKGIGTKTKGYVKIILDPLKANFKDDDILVTTMTTPEFVFIMKRASAIVTDTGGLTSHAAIVARELKKPCIIGTKIATKVLKDGDLVEVDGGEGGGSDFEKEGINCAKIAP